MTLARETRTARRLPSAGTLAAARSEPCGAFVTLGGERFYHIAGVECMRPFLVALATDTDLWAFISSHGGLTAGRRDADGALFPYETVDNLHDAHSHTGPVTVLRVCDAEGDVVLWEPFANAHPNDATTERGLYKNVVGNRLVFEEVRHDLGLAFQYEWAACDAFGLVRTVTVRHTGRTPLRIEVLDGVRNVLPSGVPLRLTEHASCLVDAYKRVDVDPETRLAVFSLTTTITDRAEALEELRASIAWCEGLEAFDVVLSADAIAAFRRGRMPAEERVLTGRRGNYFIVSTLALDPGQSATWRIVMDTQRSHADIAAMRERLLHANRESAAVETALRDATENIRRIVGSADGLQLTDHHEATAHHFANVLFNTMRGGVFVRNSDIPTVDLLDFLRARNRIVAARDAAFVKSLPEWVPAPDLLRAADAQGDRDLQRLCRAYLPLFFGRRHGDPSRPWNRFAIVRKNADGTEALHYEGNWRDIFQNWEATSFSFPPFLPSIVSTFVGASTVDGFNPYRIARDGVDWEVPNPEDPWSHIGYWGDHQIIYMLKFLEMWQHVAPGELEDTLGREIFSYADVPYRLKRYADILADPQQTIVYDVDRAARIAERIARVGADGALVTNADGSICMVSLLEKLLVPLLSKLSNLVPGGGIWMNTQRPEWNDANNALVGNGVSMVTLFHLRRYACFLQQLLEPLAEVRVPVSREVVVWLRRIHAILEEAPVARSAEEPEARRKVMDDLGLAFETYRETVYANGFGGAKSVSAAEAAELCRVALPHIEETIRRNLRPDGLYHSYNLLDITRDPRRADLQPLEEMLEGQVAALSSGAVGADEAAALVSRLFESRLYRADQESFLLYPAKDLPRFFERNVVPDDAIVRVALLRDLLAAGHRSIVERDAFGVCRFHADLHSAPDLARALDVLAHQDAWRERVERDRSAVLDVFEDVFRHAAYTGRSSAMYAYEGIGSVYWHMVGKLLLAVQEIAVREDARHAGVIAAYHRVRSGLCFEKSVAEYGAFPCDPYSHTPEHAGAQQPGMTGQVKEMILARFGELGVRVERGRVCFLPRLLQRREVLRQPAVFRCYDVHGDVVEIDVPERSLAFTCWQVPVVYRVGGDSTWIRVTARDGRTSTVTGAHLDRAMSQSLLERRGDIVRLDVGVPSRALSDA